MSAMDEVLEQAREKVRLAKIEIDRAISGGMTDGQLNAFQDHMRAMSRNNTARNYAVVAADRVYNVRDAVAASRELTAFELRVRERSFRDYEQMRNVNLTVRAMNNMIETINHDLNTIENMPATANLTWEHRRKSILIGMLQERIRQQEEEHRARMERERQAGLDAYGTYPNPLLMGEYYATEEPPTSEPKPSKTKRTKPNPLHSVKPLPRKMILDRS